MMPEIRPMIYADLSWVTEIEQTAYSFPWSATIFRDCIRVGHACYAALQENKGVGYGIMSIGAGECHFLNVCVRPEQQQCGIGTAIVEFLLDVAREQSVTTAFLEVRFSNRAAHNLYQRFGFYEIGTRKDYYPAPNGREDALVLAKELGDSVRSIVVAPVA